MTNFIVSNFKPYLVLFRVLQLHLVCFIMIKKISKKKKRLITESLIMGIPGGIIGSLTSFYLSPLVPLFFIPTHKIFCWIYDEDE